VTFEIHGNISRDIFEFRWAGFSFEGAHTLFFDDKAINFPQFRMLFKGIKICRDQSFDSAEKILGEVMCMYIIREN